MQEVNVGIIGLGNVGSGTLAILTENAEQIALKLGFPLRVKALCSRSIGVKRRQKVMDSVLRTADWREVVAHPEVDIVAELVGGTTVAREIIDAAIAHKKSVVTANKELMALCGAEIWDRAIAAGINLAMEASVAGGIPIHTVLREGISGDRVTTLYGILNGTSNYILTEIEKHGSSFDDVLKEAQRLGYAEADPSADVDGYDARSKLAILAALAFGEKITPSDIYTEGIRRILPLDFQYAHKLGHTIRLICGAHQTPSGLILSVRPALIPQVDDFGRSAGGVQCGLGARQIWRRHVLLWPGRGCFADRRGGGERPDASGARNPLREPGARVALRARAAGRIQADPGNAAALRLLSAIPSGGPAGNHREPGRRAGGQTDQPGGGVAAAERQPARPAIRDHRRTDVGAISCERRWPKCQRTTS